METHSSPDREPSPAARPDAAAVRSAFADLDADSARLADQVIAPWWYHAALGLVVAVFVGSAAVPGTVRSVRSVLIVLAVLACVILPRTLQRDRRLWVSGPLGPRSRRWWILQLVILIPLALASLVVLFLDGSFWIPLILAVVAFAATLTIGRAYDRALRADLLDGEAARR